MQADVNQQGKYIIDNALCMRSVAQKSTKFLIIK